MSTLAARIAALQRREQQQPPAASETGQQLPARLQPAAGTSQQQQQAPGQVCQAGVDAASLLARAAVLRCRDSMVQGAAAAQIHQQQQHEAGAQHALPAAAAAAAATSRPGASQAALGQLDRPEQYVEVLRSLLAAGGYDAVGDDSGDGDAFVAEMDVDDHSTFTQAPNTATQPALEQSWPAAAARGGGSGGQESMGAGQAPAGDRLGGVSCAGATHTTSAEQQQCWQQQQQQQPPAGEEQQPQVEAAAGSSGQQQQQPSQSCQAGRAPTPAGTGAASILARAAVLRGRDNSSTRVLVRTAAAHAIQQQQEQLGTPAAISLALPGLAAAGAAAAAPRAVLGQLEQPDQFVEALRGLLAAGGYDPVGDDNSSSSPGSGAECCAEMEVDGHDAATPSHHNAPAESETMLPAESVPPAAAAAAAAAAGGGEAQGREAGGTVVDSGPAQAGQAAAAAAAAAAQGVDQAPGVGVFNPIMPEQEHHQQQQQQQQQVVVGSGPDVPDHISRVLLLAGRSLTAGFPAQAREQAAVALSALQQQQQQQLGLSAASAAAADGLADAPGTSTTTSSSSSSRSLQVSLREAEQLHALATVLAEAAQHNWLAALQLPHTPPHSSSTSSSSIQRAYRRLAGFIHPDKCAHPSAASGFQALSRAHAAALQSAPQAAAGGDDGAADDEGWGADDAGGGAGDDYAWWSKWEADVSEGCIDGAAAAAGGRSRRQGDSTAAAAAADEAELWAMGLQELAAEVERRQGAVWAPQQGSDDAGFTPRERQQRVKAARSVLSQRLQAQRQQQVQQGFFADEAGGGARQHREGGGAASDGMDGDEDDGCGGWGWDELQASNEFKRQRL